MPKMDHDHPYRLPDEFGYLNGVIEKFTEDTCTEIDRAFALPDELGPEQLTELAAAYREILARDHVHALSALAERHDDAFDKVWREWCAVSNSYEDRGLPTPPGLEPQHRPRARMLFWVFEGLARKRIPPFKLREVQYSPPPVKLDWAKLPERLSYLAGPAMKYGHLQFQEQRDKFARRIKPEEHAELAALAERVRRSGDHDLLTEWSRSLPSDERHEEATLAGWLMAVLNDIIPERTAEERRAPVSGLDWSKVPEPLRYLTGYAEEYGVHKTPDERAALVFTLREEAAAGSERLDLLTMLAQLTGRRGLRKARQWAARFPADAHPESALMTSLLLLLEEQFGDEFID